MATITIWTPSTASTLTARSRPSSKRKGIHDGIICACVKNDVPFVLNGSIRDDGPLPEVYEHTYVGQGDTIRSPCAEGYDCHRHGHRAAYHRHGQYDADLPGSPLTAPSDRSTYMVDTSEFAANKLGDRGSLTAKGIVTNVQDFMTNVCKGLGL